MWIVSFALRPLDCVLNVLLPPETHPPWGRELMPGGSVTLTEISFARGKLVFSL